ncbi:MAG: DUF4411 family protein [Saprospiraceae bacterium]|nr:DUF4411 family protein [Candidatus Opimibacter skivensis]
MIEAEGKYCLDANVLIEAWQKYYNPKFCPDYWKVLNQLGKEGRIFIPSEVAEEIHRTEDDLSAWLKASDIPIAKTTESVIRCWQKILASHPDHQRLVDSTKNRSLADPWVIAHAMDQSATVVTKENKETASNTRRVKIPNVCENMGVRWMDDFQFIEENNIKFSSALTS